ncbi:MAG: type II toxin-antitoxin system HicB family antitoxin [Candidatus Binataceae bacterium]
MTGTLNHNGYTGSVEFSEEDGLLNGKLIGIRDAITYEGKDVKSLTRNFRKAVDEYLAFCEVEGKTPDKPFKGSLNIRISPELHRTLATRAEQKQKSLNAVISDALESSCR